MCKLILYSFYKNVCLYVIELWFAIYSGWSGQILFERWTIGLYNVVFTALPPFAMGMFDKVCSAEVMLKYPLLYQPSQNAQLLNVRVFWVWIMNAVMHSLILFWMPMLLYGTEIVWTNGRNGGYLVMGNMVYTVSRGFDYLGKFPFIYHPFISLPVCRRNCVSEGRSGDQLLAPIDSRGHLGIDLVVVRLCGNLQQYLAHHPSGRCFRGNGRDAVLDFHVLVWTVPDPHSCHSCGRGHHGVRRRIL